MASDESLLILITSVKQPNLLSAEKAFFLVPRTGGGRKLQFGKRNYLKAMGKVIEHVGV